MELRVLEYYLALTHEGSVSAAAEVLHISQPTLSRQLIDLERELGTTLFERGRHGIQLTEDGLLLRRRAQEIVDLAHITETEIRTNKGEIAGEIRIGCAETRAMDLLAHLMRTFRAEHPQVTFRIVSDLAENVVEQINRGLLDFGLLLRLNDTWGLHGIKLPTNEQIVVLMRTDSPLARLETVTLNDLATQPVLLPSSYQKSGLAGTARPKEEGGTLEVVAYFDLPYNASRMVKAGMGCALTLAGLIDEDENDHLAVRPLDLAVDLPSYLAWKPFQQRTRACTAFLEAAQATFDGRDSESAIG